MMRSRIDDLIASIDKSTTILNLAERKGMEVSKPKFELKGATDALTHTTTLTVNNLNRVTQVQDALTHTMGTSYDPEGNVLSTTALTTPASSSLRSSSRSWLRCFAMKKPSFWPTKGESAAARS